jgi:hypothetical protein
MEHQTTTEKENCDLNHNSISPAIKESERFILFLNDKFGLELKKDWIITISKTKPSNYGHFQAQAIENTTKKLNNINLNLIHLKKCNPYEVLTHELAHYINFSKGINDCSSNQYHNKHFKAQAERLLLKVERMGKKGYAKTSESEEWLKMLEEFKPNKEVFNFCQNHQEKAKKPQLNLKYVCDCGYICRSSRIDFSAECNYCQTTFKRCEK